MAGVAEILSHYSIKEGAYCKVLQLRNLDVAGFGDYYGLTHFYNDVDNLIEAAKRLEPEFDIIVLHDYHEFLDEFPLDKVWLFFHGSKLRADSVRVPGIISQIKALKRVFVSTSDLLQILPNAIHLPQPLDMELFYNKAHQKEGQLCINTPYQFEYKEKVINKSYPNCIVKKRGRLIPYEKMPEFLNQWESYVDWKFTYDTPPRSLPDPSCTGMQAMACGCKVFGPKGERDQSLLLKHDAKKVTRKFLDTIQKSHQIKRVA